MRYLLILFMLCGCIDEARYVSAGSDESIVPACFDADRLECKRGQLYIDGQRYILVTADGDNVVWKAH